MDLMRLGYQSRKTGLKRKQNVAKDIHDMEDIDEFFSEAGWSISGPDASHGTSNSYAAPKAQDKANTSLRHDGNASRVRAEVASSRTSALSTKIRGQDGLTADSPGFDNQVSPTYEAHDPDGNASFFDESFQDPVDNGHEDSISVLPSAPLLIRNSLMDKQSQQGPKKHTPRYTKKMITVNPYRGAELNGGSPETVAAKHFTRVELPSGEASLGIQRNKTAINEKPQNRDLKKTNLYESQSLPSPPPEGLRRSKRTKIAPLAFWRNERIIYTRAREKNSEVDSTLIRDIRKIPLQEIVEVIHVPEKAEQVIGEKTKRKPKYRKSKPSHREEHKPKDENFDYESDPGIEGSEWFQRKLLETEVFENEETMTKRVIAWTPDGGSFQLPPALKEEQRTPENFEVALLFDSQLNHFASGLLKFPRDGFKSLRTTGDSLFVFHVARGLIEVTLNSDKFIVTRGCSFEIPKYNIYSFKNLGHGDAKLFFVQCQTSEA